MTEPVGHPQLPDYDFDRELGRGGMGTVYLYRHAITQRPEVVKLLSPEVLARPGNRGRFEREIRAAFKLSHPNIVAAYSTHRVGDTLAFCMEYVEGDDLMKVVQREGPLPPGVAVAYVVQACYGLQHAFERGMVHRDIKPNNLMRTTVGGRTVVKVVDFGLAKLAGEPGATSDTGLTQYGQVLGTPDYIAPEQIRNTSAADIRSDLYSLGCTLYYLLAGRPPFKGESLFDLFEMHIHGEAPGLDRVREGLPPGLAGVVARMMAKDPAARPQTPDEAAEALQPFAQVGTHSAPALALPPIPAPPTTSVSEAVTPPQSPARPPVPIRLSDPVAPPPPADQFISLTSTNFDPPPSTRYRPVRPAPAPSTRPGWLVPLGVGAFVLAGLAVLAFVVLSDNTIRTDPTDLNKTRTPPTPVSPPTPLTPPTPNRVETPPTVGPTTPPTIKTTPTTPSSTTPAWYTSLFGNPAAGLKQTVWPKVEGWQLRSGALTAPDAAEERLALFDGPQYKDFDLTAELVVSGGAGLLVRGDLRAAAEQPTGYLVGLGRSTADTIAFDCGAIHRWGIKDGRSKKLADGVTDWATPGKSLNVSLEVRGDRLSVQIDGRKAVHVRDADGYSSGLIGLVTQPGGSVVVRSLVVKPVRAADPPADAVDPGFTPLIQPDRLAGWVTEGDDSGWEMIGGMLQLRAPGVRGKPRGHLLSEREFGDFVLRFDCWFEPDTAALVSVRAVLGERLEETGKAGPQKRAVHPWALLSDVVAAEQTKLPAGMLEYLGGFNGKSFIRRLPAKADKLDLRSGTWHPVELTVQGLTATLVVDGRKVVDQTGEPGDRPAGPARLRLRPTPNERWWPRPCWPGRRTHRVRPDAWRRSPVSQHTGERIAAARA